MVKKITNIRMEDSTAKRLKMLSVQHDRPMGEAIEGLLDFVDEINALKEPATPGFLRGLLGSCMRVAGVPKEALSAWGNEEPAFAGHEAGLRVMASRERKQDAEGKPEQPEDGDK